MSLDVIYIDDKTLTPAGSAKSKSGEDKRTTSSSQSSPVIEAGMTIGFAKSCERGFRAGQQYDRFKSGEGVNRAEWR